VTLGLLLSVAVGPVFFALIQISLQKGFRAGLSFALGVSLSDFACILLAYLGLSQLSGQAWLERNLAIAGGLVFIGFGLASIFRKAPTHLPTEEKMGKRSYFEQMAKGSLINIINPSVWLFWMGVVSLASSDYQFESTKVSIFLASILITVFSLDLAKAYLANKLKPLVTPKALKNIYIVVGFALIGFGIKLIFF